MKAFTQIFESKRLTRLASSGFPSNFIIKFKVQMSEPSLYAYNYVASVICKSNVIQFGELLLLLYALALLSSATIDLTIKDLQNRKLFRDV